MRRGRRSLPAIADRFAFREIYNPLNEGIVLRKGDMGMEYNCRITGQVIGRLRMDRGMTQEVLSGLAGIARSHLAMIETGSKNANAATLWRIAAALDMRMSDLVRLIEQAHERG